jgi:hypothetical protein
MDKLKFINEQMDMISVPYQFGEWSSSVVYPYGVGEITEDPITTEDGAEHSTLLLTFFNRGNMIDLLEIKEKIKKHFDPIYGLRGDTNGGSIAVFYDGFFPIPSGEADLKKIQINIKINEWKGAV